MEITKAFDLWMNITGVNPNDTSIRLRDMDVHTANGVLKNSLQYDTTYVTTFMLMKMYLEEFLENRSISLKEIIDKYDVFKDWLAQIDELKSILYSEEVTSNQKAFQALLKQGLAHYGADDAVYDSMVANEENLAEIRFSSFNAINQLEVVQFSHGLPSEKRAKVHSHVHLFKDINTLLSWMMNVESGVVLAMIQDEKQLSDAYFVFAIRNGGTLSVLTDRKKTAHPLQSMMSRTRLEGRQFYERISQYHFPYSILDITYGDNGRAYITSEETSLMQKEEGFAVKEIKDLEHDEIVWIMMMFDFIEEKFFREDFKVKELSYTAKMIENTNFLLENAKGHEVAIQSYPKLQLPVLTNEFMKTENLKDVFRRKPLGLHDWMVERYEVPVAVFDVVGNAHETLLLTDGKENMDSSVVLKNMDISSFKTAEELQKDRIFIARYNQAKIVSLKAKEEFNQRQSEVENWYKEAIRKNLPNLITSITQGEFIVSKDKEKARIRNGNWERRNDSGNILRVDQTSNEEYGGYIFCHITGEKLEKDISIPTCIVSDKQATILGHFYPKTASQLADLCGCEEKDLHELLQHWNLERKDNGNQLLENLDPLDWAVENPWEKMRMDVKIYLTKREYNKLCKQHQTGKESFWNQYK